MSVLSNILNGAAELQSVYLAEISALKVIKYWTADPTSPSSTYETPFPFDGNAYITGVNYGDTTTGQNIPLALAASASAVSSTPGSYYWDQTNLYVQAPGGQDPRVPQQTITVEVTYYFCTHTAKTFNDIYYQPLLLQVPSMSLAVEQDFSGVAQISAGSTVLDNSTGFFDLITDLNWDGGQTVIYLGADQPSLGQFMDIEDYQCIGTWMNDNWVKTNQNFTMNNLENKNILTQNIPQNLYAVDNYPNLDTNASGNVIPWAYGQIFGAAPTCINTNPTEADINGVPPYTFKVADHPIFSIDAVRISSSSQWVDVDLSKLTLNLAEGQFSYPGWDGQSNLSVDFHGKTNRDGTWMDNASDMVKDLLFQSGQTQLNYGTFQASHDNLVIGTQQTPIPVPAVELPDELSYVEADDLPTQLNGMKDFTFECWVYQTESNTSTGNQILMAIDELGDTSNTMMCVFQNSGTNALNFALDGYTFQVQFGDLPQNQWTHVAVTRLTNPNSFLQLGATITAWVNGQSAGSWGYNSAAFSALDFPGVSFKAGIGQQSDYGFVGQIREVRLSSTCLYTETFTPPEVLGNTASTYLYWKLNEGSGTVANDSSGYDNDGTLEENATWVSAAGLLTQKTLDISEMVPALYLDTAQTFLNVVQSINEAVSSYLFVDPNGLFNYVVFVPQPGAGLNSYEDIDILDFSKENPTLICQSRVTALFANRVSDGWGQVLTVENTDTQYSTGQPAPISAAPTTVPLSTLQDATTWAYRQLIYYGKKPGIYLINLPWEALLLLPTNQILVQYSRPNINEVFEIMEIDTGMNAQDAGSAGGATSTGASSYGGSGVEVTVSNLHNFNNQTGFWVDDDGEELLPVEFANLDGYGSGSLNWNAEWDPQIKAWAMQNVGYWTDQNGFIQDSTTGLPDPVTQGQSVWF